MVVQMVGPQGVPLGGFAERSPPGGLPMMGAPRGGHTFGIPHARLTWGVPGGPESGLQGWSPRGFPHG